MHQIQRRLHSHEGNTQISECGFRRKWTVFGSSTTGISSIVVGSDRSFQSNYYRYETKITSSYTAKDAHDYQKNWKRTSVNNANKTAKFITEFYDTDRV